MTEELSDEARDLIALARGGESEPSSRDLARIRNGVLSASLGAATVLGSGSAVALGGKTLTATLIATGLKGVVLGAVVAAGATSASFYFEESAKSTSAVRSVASPAAVVASPKAKAVASYATPHALPATNQPPARDIAQRPTPSAAIAEPAGPTPVQTGPAFAVPPSGDFVPAESALTLELDVLRRAQAELRAERGTRALALLDENAAALSRGQLRQERLAVEVLAACLAGQVERSRLAARRFRAENPATPAAARIRASCVGEELP
jgi:hypothetical protein